MIVLGADAHERSHTIAAVSATTGEVLGEQAIQVGAEGFAGLLIWTRSVGGEAGVGAGGLSVRVGLVRALLDRAWRACCVAS